MTITLPDDVRAEAEAKAAATGYPDVASYLTDLIRSDADDYAAELAAANPPPELVVRDRADLEAKLLEGLNSGPSILVTPEFWAERRRRLEERIAAHQARQP